MAPAPTCQLQRVCEANNCRLSRCKEEWMLCSLKEKIHTYVQQPLKMTPSAVPLAPASEARIAVLAANRLGFSPCSSGGDRFDPVTGWGGMLIMRQESRQGAMIKSEQQKTAGWQFGKIFSEIDTRLATKERNRENERREIRILKSCACFFVLFCFGRN